MIFNDNSSYRLGFIYIYTHHTHTSINIYCNNTESSNELIKCVLLSR